MEIVEKTIEQEILELKANCYEILVIIEMNQQKLKENHLKLNQLHEQLKNK